jgi:hypothetical protein
VDKAGYQAHSMEIWLTNNEVTKKVYRNWLYFSFHTYQHRQTSIKILDTQISSGWKALSCLVLFCVRTRDCLSCIALVSSSCRCTNGMELKSFSNRVFYASDASRIIVEHWQAPCSFLGCSCPRCDCRHDNRTSTTMSSAFYS